MGELREAARVQLPTVAGEFDARAFTCGSGYVYLALIKGDLSLDAPRKFRRSFLRARGRVLILGMVAGVVFLPLTFLRLVQGTRRGSWLVVRRGGRLGPLGRVDWLWAGQAARADGGPVAASNRFIQSCSRCQPSGRCKVISPRPWRAIRAATLIRSRRSVAPLPLAQARLARDPAARSRLCAMAAQASQAAFAGKEPEGRWATGPSVQSAKTCSTTAWSRWCSSAWMVWNGESVNTAW